METTWYYENVARRRHPEVRGEWVERILTNPHHIEIQPDGRIRYYGYIEEVEKWIRVIVDDGKLLNRFFDHHALNRWGMP